jgi:hypothetical protein
MPLTHPSTPISQAEVCAFRLLKKSALTFLLLLRLDSLASIGLITRIGRRAVYNLTQARRLLLMPEAEPEDPSSGDMEEFPPYRSIIN